MTALLRVPPEALEAAARLLRITDHQTGATTLWAPNTEQLSLWRELHTAHSLFAAKPRRVGATTAVELDDLLWTAVNDRGGHRVRCGLVMHTDDATRERALLAASFATQLSIPIRSATTERVIFRGGSELVFLTAGAHGIGRGDGFQRLHLSEVPFWPNPDTYGSLRPMLSEDGQLIIETTIDVSAPCGQLARTLWRELPSSVQRVFFSVEGHDLYRRDEAEINDAEWAMAAALGFTRRDSAAWWILVALRDKCVGDVVRALREYPQRAEHMFQSSSSRWCTTTPKVLTPLRTIPIDGAAVSIWREPADTSGQCVISVDTAGGKGRDRSSIVVIDKKDKALCATLIDDRITTPSLARACALLSSLYSREVDLGEMRGLYRASVSRPEVVVEDNGIGESTVQHCRETGLEVVPVTVDSAGAVRYDALLLAREAVDSGWCAGPPELAEEADSLHRDPIGRFVGRKDTLMALGHGLCQLRRSPYRAPVSPPQVDIIRGSALFRRHHPRVGGGWG